MQRADARAHARAVDALESDMRHKRGAFGGGGTTAPATGATSTTATTVSTTSAVTATTPPAATGQCPLTAAVRFNAYTCRATLVQQQLGVLDPCLPVTLVPTLPI